MTDPTDDTPAVTYRDLQRMGSRLSELRSLAFALWQAIDDAHTEQQLLLTAYRQHRKEGH